MTALAKKFEEGKLRSAATAAASSTATATATAPAETPAAASSKATATATAETPAAATVPTINTPAPVPAKSSVNPTEKTETPPNALEKAPAIPPQDLQMIVNVLDAGECSRKTFSHTVSFIQAVSIIPHGQETIASELLERAKFLGNALLPDLDELASAIREAPNAAEVCSTTLAKFSSASAQQAKLLRVLKCTEFLDAHTKKQETAQLPMPELSSPLTMTASTPLPDLFSPTSSKVAEESKAQTVRFRPLWAKLSECLTLIQERDDMTHIATVLLPYLSWLFASMRESM